MTARTFDWHPNPALQGAGRWDVSLRLGASPTTAAGPVLWPIGITLDQGPEGECVGHGWAHALAASPNPNAVVGSVILQNPVAELLYERAQFFDGSPPDEQSGASVGAGAKAAAEMGAITAYHWATTLTAVQQALLLGPVVLGMNWYAGMMTPDAGGVIHPTGVLEGGHCILDRGYDPATGLHTLHQSWGQWGRNGDCYLHDADLALLLSQNGEAAIPTKVAAPAPVPASPDHDLAVVARPWAAQRHTGQNHLMAVALQSWMTAKGV